MATILYQPQYRVTGTTPWINWGSAEISALTITFGAVPPGPALTPGTTYDFQVLADNGSGLTTPSSIVTLTTPNAAIVITGITVSQSGVTIGTGQTATTIQFSSTATSGTLVGTIAVQVGATSPAFSGNYSLSGTNASSFTLVGNTITVNGPLAAGNYSLNVIATPTTGTAFTQAISLTSAAVATITNITLSSASFPSSGAVGTVIGSVTVSGTSLTNVVLSISGTSAADFAISGTNLTTKVANLSVGSYSISITATQGTVTLTKAFTLTSVNTSSPNNTVIGSMTSSATQITDNNGNVWTLVGGVATINGILTTNTSGITELLWYNNLIYQWSVSTLNPAPGLWWSCPSGSTTTPTWTFLGAANPLSASSSGSNIPAVAQLVDSSSNIWYLVGGIAYVNGAVTTNTSGTVELLWYNSLIYQYNGTYWWSCPPGSTVTPTWTSTVNPLPSVGFTFTVPTTGTTVKVSTAYAVSGTISGYSTAPTMQYQVTLNGSAGGWLALPGGATVTSTTFAFTAPAIATLGSNDTITVRDANATTVATTSGTFSVVSPGFTVTAPVTGAKETINATYTVSGNIAGYTTAPTMQYQISINGTAGSWLSLPSGNTVTSTTFTFTAPAIAAASTNITVAVRDASATTITAISGVYSVNAVTSIEAPLGVHLGTWLGGGGGTEGSVIGHWNDVKSGLNRTPVVLAAVLMNSFDPNNGGPSPPASWGGDYSQWSSNGFPVDGSVSPLLHGHFTNGTTTDSDYAGVIAGTYDTYLTNAMNLWKGLGSFKKIYFRINWEFDANFLGWGVPSSSQVSNWVAAWKYWANLLHTWGNNNGIAVRMVWSPSTSYTIGGGTFGLPVINFFPTPDSNAVNNRYIDVLGCDNYMNSYSVNAPNLGQTGSTNWSMGTFVAMCQAYNCNFGISETGDGSSFDNNASWTDGKMSGWATYLNTLATLSPAVPIEYITIFDVSAGGASQFTGGNLPNMLAAWRSCLGVSGNGSIPTIMTIPAT